MARRGRKRQLDVEAQYWALLANGIGTVEACRTLGIGRKTGYRWRAETGGLAPELRSRADRKSGLYLCQTTLSPFQPGWRVAKKPSAMALLNASPCCPSRRPNRRCAGCSVNGQLDLPTGGQEFSPLVAR